MKKTILFVMAGLILFGGNVMAQTLTANASVDAACTLVTDPTLNFGTYDPTSGSPISDEGSLVFRCTKGTAYEVTMPAAGRSMLGPTSGDTLNYDVFYEGTWTNSWEPATGTYAGANGMGTAASSVGDITATLYGQVAASQDVGVDAGYTGTLALTINY